MDRITFDKFPYIYVCAELLGETANLELMKGYYTDPGYIQTVSKMKYTSELSTLQKIQIVLYFNLCQ